jgi:hypothetical protein
VQGYQFKWKAWAQNQSQHSGIPQCELQRTYYSIYSFIQLFLNVYKGSIRFNESHWRWFLFYSHTKCRNEICIAETCHIFWISGWRVRARVARSCLYITKARDQSLKFVTDEVPLEQDFLLVIFLQFSPVDHRSTIVPYSLTASWGVQVRLYIITFSVPQLKASSLTQSW